MASLALFAVVFIGFVAALTIYLVFSGALTPKGNTTQTPNTNNQQTQPSSASQSPSQSNPPSTVTNFYPVPNPAWQDVQGYADAFNQCKSLCFAYRNSGCSEDAANDYCTNTFSIDLDKNGQISSSEFGTTPSGGNTCETNSHCYDVIENCPCGTGNNQNQTLNLGGCVQILYDISSKQGVASSQLYQTVISQLKGNCTQNAHAAPV